MSAFNCCIALDGPLGALESDGSGDGLMTRGMLGIGSDDAVPDMFALVLGGRVSKRYA